MTIRHSRLDVPIPERYQWTHSDVQGTLWVDIETTGLTPDCSHITVIGYLRAEDHGRQLTQLFAEEPAEEQEILKKAARDWEQDRVVVTYNGGRFDSQFLSQRSAFWGIRFPRLRYIDLLQEVHHLDPRRRLFPDHRLQTIMREAGVCRGETSRGDEMVNAYRRWLERRRPKDRDEILAHNADDILWLPEVAVYVTERIERQRVTTVSVRM